MMIQTSATLYAFCFINPWAALKYKRLLSALSLATDIFPPSPPCVPLVPVWTCVSWNFWKNISRFWTMSSQASTSSSWEDGHRSCHSWTNLPIIIKWSCPRQSLLVSCLNHKLGPMTSCFFWCIYRLGAYWILDFWEENYLMTLICLLRQQERKGKERRIISGNRVKHKNEYLWKSLHFPSTMTLRNSSNSMIFWSWRTSRWRAQTARGCRADHLFLKFL